MSTAGVVLLGPQFHEPTVGTVLDDLDVSGPVATITAGWQEWESEDTALMRELGGHGVPLRLYQRAERVWAADPALREEHQAMQAQLRTLRSLYNRQLEPAAQAWVELLALEEDEALVEPERRAALEHIQRLDTHLLERIEEIRGDFDARLRPLERNQPDRVALVFEADVETGCERPEVRPVLFQVRGIHHEPETLIAEPVDDQVVDHAAVLVTEDAVLRLPLGELRGIVRRHERHERQRVGACDQKLPHV